MTGWHQQNFWSEVGGVSYLMYEKIEGMDDETNLLAFFLTVALAGTYKYPWLVMG